MLGDVVPPVPLVIVARVGGGPVAGEYLETVRTTWKRSFDAVAAASPASIALLRLSAFFAPYPIPYELITKTISAKMRSVRSRGWPGHNAAGRSRRTGYSPPGQTRPASGP